MRTMISYDEARRLVLGSVPVVGSERIPLARALGRTLAEPVESREMIPPFDNSAMDGFGVRATDVPHAGVLLRIAGTVAAGSDVSTRLPENACVRIMTGAPIPDGVDAVIPVEQSEADDDRVRFQTAAVPGAYIRRAGENVAAGEHVLEQGARITPPVVGMLAVLGYAAVAVARRPVVSVITTGDELVDVADTPGPGQIRDANGPALAAQLTAAGAVPDGPRRVGDERRLLREALKSAAEADVVVVSGGVSMGEFDFVREELERVGFETLFWKVRQKPGKPLLFGLIDQTPVFGLPGNPVSTAVCFEQYVRPALAAMLGRSDAGLPHEKALLDADVRKSAGLHHFVRGHLTDDAGLRVAPTGPQGSHVSRSLVLADCLIHLPEDMEDPPRGTEVRIERLAW